MVIEFNKPIGSSNKGFFMIVNDEDFQIAITHLMSRVEKTNNRIKSLKSLRKKK